MFKSQKVLGLFVEKFDWKALGKSSSIDNTKDILRESKERCEYHLQYRE